MLLEVIAASCRDVRAAAAGGADRVELVSAMSEGGLTPSGGLIAEAAAVGRQVGIAVNVMIRPHSHSFVYDDDDLAVMRQDIALAREAGAAGVVFGALTASGDVDEHVLNELLAAAAGLDVTFHRAFDAARDLLATLHLLSGYPQISRVLTSGGAAPAPQAVGHIRQLQAVASGTHLHIMAGHGLQLEGIASFVAATGVPEVHFGSAVRADGTYATDVESAKVVQLRRVL